MMSDVTGLKSVKNALVGFLLACGGLLAAAECVVAQTADIDHVNGFPNSSFCELCDGGRVRIEIRNTTRVTGPDDITNLVVTEDLGEVFDVLRYVPGSADISIFGQADPGNVEPNISGSQLEWDLGGVVLERDQLMVITFDLAAVPGEQEELVNINRDLDVTVTFNLVSNGNPGSGADFNHELPIREPRPSISKTGINVDAGMDGGDYSETVFGHEDDGVVWQVALGNSGPVTMQEVVISDEMLPPGGSMLLEAICNSHGAAVAAADSTNPGSISGCTDISGENNDLDGLDSGDVGFSLDVPPGGRSIFFAGRLRNSCDNQTNRFHSLQWGCPQVPPSGGIFSPAEGSDPGDDTADLSVLSNGGGDQNTNVIYGATFTGLNGEPEPGMRGLVTLTVENLSGGTIKGVRLTNALPQEYSLDPNFEPQFNVTSTFGDYDGRVSGYVWENEVTPTPGNQSYLADPDLKTPVFFLTSGGERANGNSEQVDLLRHGDVATITFRIVQTQPNTYDFYDRQADLDQGGVSDPDPGSMGSVTNNLQIEWEDFCSTGGFSHIHDHDEDFNPAPENLEVDIPDPLYIIRDTGTTNMPVLISNSGDHTATDFYAYVTFGAAMEVVGVPPVCQPADNPPLHPDTGQQVPIWSDPDTIPASADEIYLCSDTTGMGSIPGGQSRTLTFEVQKHPNAQNRDDDLTFRVDVVGEVALANGESLQFPAPQSNPDTTPQLPQANNYTLDAVRARVLGFNLLKEQIGCTELNEAGFPIENIIIGEECQFEIYAGGWFGFETPGFSLIEVNNIDVVDDIPGGQGYIDHNPRGCAEVTPPIPDWNPANCIGISGDFVEGGGLNQPLDETDLQWNNPGTVDERNRWFLADMTTRLLNAPMDTVALPNEHLTPSIDFGRANFTAVFDTQTIPVSENEGIPGYPPIEDWREELTITEPDFTIEKTVCNETAAGTCDPGDFSATTTGTRFDSYIYKITVTNGAAPRAPGFDLVVTETLDALKQMCVEPFANDGLDNDGDGPADAGDTDPTAGGSTTEGWVGTAIFQNDYNPNFADAPSDPGFCGHRDQDPTAQRAVLTFRYTHAPTSMDRLDPGESIEFVYRVTLHESVAPNQSFTTDTEVRFDSLPEDASFDANNQRAFPVNSDADQNGLGCGNDPDETSCGPTDNSSGRARHYEIDRSETDLMLLDIVSQPKTAGVTSNGTSNDGSLAVIGEQIRYTLPAQIPPAQLQQFTVVDNLPAGMSCADVPAVDLDNYPGANFVPGGVFRMGVDNVGGPGGSSDGVIDIECTGDRVQWNFGDQAMNLTSPGSLLDFNLEFIAQIENIAANTESTSLVNGGGGTGTVAELSYRDENNLLVTRQYGAHTATVVEPSVTLAKSILEPDGDAGDIVTVRVEATYDGNGNTRAYNLCVLEDLDSTKYDYIPGSFNQGANPPDNVDESDPSAPVFCWNVGTPGYEVANGSPVSFDFNVRIQDDVEPHEILNNEIYTTWQSLPGDHAPFSTQPYGADGDVDGVRIGQFPGVADPFDPTNSINTYEFGPAAAAIEVLPGIALTKTALAPPAGLSVGSHQQFELVIELPEGVSNTVTIADNLNFGGTSYELTTGDGNFPIECTYIDIESIDSGSGLQNVSASPFVDANCSILAGPSATNGVATWTIGTVDTNQEDDNAGTTVNPQIVVRYWGRAENEVNTQNGVDLRNQATLSYATQAGSDTLVGAPASLPVIEPDLQVTKTVNDPNGGNAESGDILEYTVTISHTGASTADAFDLSIEDTPVTPGQLQYRPGSAQITSSNCTISGQTDEPNIAGNSLQWGRLRGDNALDMPGAACVLTLYYEMDVLSGFGGSIDNNVGIGWTSQDSGSNEEPYERGDSDCSVNDWVPAGLNDYCANASESIVSTDNTSIAKSIIDNSFEPAADLSTVRVGDSITFRLAMELQAGDTDTVVVTDNLPAGLELDFVQSSSCSATGYSCTNEVQPSPGPGTMTWTYDTINRQPGTVEPFEIVYVARVADVAAIGPGVASTPLSNDALLVYSGSGSHPNPDDLNDSVTVNVVQPIIDNLTKDAANFPGSHMNVDLANDVMQFTLTACNIGGAPSYELQLTDDLGDFPGAPDQPMDASSINNLSVSIGGTPLTDGVDYTYTAPAARGDDMVFNLTAPIDPSECLEIYYEIGFHTDVPGGTTWDNDFAVDTYWSLPAASGRQYAAVPLPTPYPMGTVAATVNPLQKVLQTDTTAAVGEEVVYRITVPGTATTSAIYDVAVTDTLDPVLVPVSVAEVSGNNIPFNDSSTGNNLSYLIEQIPAGQTAIFEITARVANNATAVAGYNIANSADFDYAETDGGPATNGGPGSAADITIVEPQLALTKTLTNQTDPGNPDAGDVLRFTLDLSETGGASASEAFDLRVLEQLTLGLEYLPGSTTFGGSPIDDPTVTGDGVASAQTLEWAVGSHNLDIAIGTNSALVFDVVVRNEVLASQELFGTSRIEWTSLDDDNSGIYERNGTLSQPENIYFLEDQLAQLDASNDNSIAKIRLTDTFGTGDNQLRIGDTVDFELRMNVQEGAHPSTVITDMLPQGLVFERTLTVNGETAAPFAAAAPFQHGTISEPVPAGDPATGPSSVSWDLGDLANVADNDAANDEFVITYRARVLNQDVHPQQNNISLNNNAEFAFESANGPEALSANETLDLLQPTLAVAIASTPADGGVLSANDTVEYTVTVSNGGTAPAYDLVLRDTVPTGLRQAGITVVSTTIGGSVVADVAPSFDPSTGEAIWNFGIGTAHAIPAGVDLVVVYEVQADAGLSAGLNMTNGVFAEVYYSLDDDALPVDVSVDMREDYGPTTPVGVTFTTPNAEPLNIDTAYTTASIGEPFTYTVTIPATPQTAWLNDVQLHMNLDASAADLVFVEAQKVSGSADFAPENTGSGTDLVIEDTTNGIDIPPGEQAVIEVTVRLRDTAGNVDGLVFNNSASYSFNLENDNPAAGQGMGAGNSSGDTTVVEPTDLTMTKTGPASVQSGLPGRFTLDVHNIGTGPAWDITVTDILPDNDPGGMCETPPANFAALVADGAGNTVATLNAGEHFNTAFDPATCTLTVTTVGAVAAIPADHRLLFSYDAYLDADTVDGDTLTNIAGVELWHSWDSSGPDARQYTRAAPTDGTPSVVDHEDAYTVSAMVPSVSFYKTVENVTSGQNPADVASPGDMLRYTLTLTSLNSVDVSDIQVTDALDRLNSLPLYESGSLQVISVPAGADESNTDPAGGANGSGLLDVRNISLAAGASATIVYEVTLAAVIDSGTAVLNQAQVQLPGQLLADSDDPNINGADDPDLAGDEDPTQVIIESAPQLVVEKTSEDITGDAALLMAGDTLRYTLRVENIGNENIVDALLRDQVPANTTYVAGSTMLNGTAVGDVGGSTPLASGMAINSPGEVEGFVGAVATGAGPVIITFDVTINDVNDGTIISNQGYVNGAGAGSGAFDEVPSDDPATDAPNDPTIDIVGDLPLLIAHKTVEIAVDNVSPGIVDPGDVLRYTIAVTNRGGVDATQVALTDQMPANTTYVAGSTTLNGMAVADNGGGTSRLDAGLPIASDDLTPPLPGAGEGVITSAQTATVTFDVMVNAGTPTGTVISNQGSVYSAELPLTLTDADGNPSNGAQPTEVVVGDAQQLSITKEVAVVGGGAAEAGATLEYLVTITNISAVPATYVTITDDLLVAGENVLTYVADSAMLNGQADGITVDGTVITADFAAVYGELQPGDMATLRFQAKLSENLEIGYRVLNTAVVQWNDPPATNQASVAIDVGGTPGIANLNGYLWHDVNFNEQLDAEERLLLNWTVDLYFNNALLETVQSDENGYFQFDGLVPNYASSAAAGGASYELRYTAPDAGETTASLGNTSSDFTNGPQRISEIYVDSGANPQNLNLPITPNGVVYDSVLRQPITGATLTMLRASSDQALPDRCFDDEKQQNQVTQAGGYYKFDINFSDAACPANADYLIRVQLQGDGYVAGESQIIPPQTNADTAGFDVGACLGSGEDLIPGTAQHCEVQLSALPPPVDVDARDAGTDYYLRLTLDDNRIPGESQLFNNHIPLDPQLEGALSITKTAALLNVTRSQLVPYTITFGNTLPVPLTDLQLVDFFPAGFKYVAGSARLDGEAVEPEVNGLQLQWPDLRVEAEQTREVKLLLVVGSGVGEGKYVNRARMFNQLSGQVASGEASATVRVVPDPTFDCTDVIGKVYDDKNMNGYQDAGEGGVPGARVVTATGLNATTDAHGRFHITCAVVPDRDRGSNFIMKLDDRSLPSGYRLTSENPRVVRATRGKAIKINFGASLHRVVRLDLAEAVFEPGTTELRPQWQSRTGLLLEKLSEAPSLLRLAYLAEIEDPDLVERRLAVIKTRIAEAWAEQYGDYELTIETEVFWRRGAPPSKGGLE